MADPPTTPLQSQLEHPVHLSAYAYWRSRRLAVGGIPARQDIDPLDIPGLLPWMNLIEVHRFPEGLRYRHRLIGTGIVQMRNRDNTGRWFHEIYDAERLARTEHPIRLVVETGEPHLHRQNLADAGKPYRTMIALILPLATDHVQVDMLMSVSQYE